MKIEGLNYTDVIELLQKDPLDPRTFVPITSSVEFGTVGMVRRSGELTTVEQVREGRPAVEEHVLMAA